MSYQAIGTDLGNLIAAADLSARQFHFVKVDSAGKIALCGLGEGAIGVLQNDPLAGEPCTVRVSGVSKVVADAAVAAGARVKSSADGQAATAAAGTTNTSDAGAASDPLVGSFAMGVALEAAAGAGVVFAVLIEHLGVVPTTAA